MFDYVSCYNMAVNYRREGDLARSAEFHVKAIQMNPSWDLPEAWHNAGAALIRIKKEEQALPYLEKAKALYDVKIAHAKSNKAYYIYWKACILALLKERGDAFRTLKLAIDMNGVYAEEARSEEDFKEYFRDPDFLFVLQSELKVREEKFFRGDSISKDELKEDQLKFIEAFNYILGEHDWIVDDLSLLFETGLGVSPQAKASFKLGSDYILKLDLHVDTFLLFFEIVHRHNSADKSPFRLYFDEYEMEEKLPAVLNMIAQYQDYLNEHNKKAMIQALIPLCSDLLMEMPDGKKIRIRG